ncbi:MAG: Lpg1974 family pore-forming outer membrane protein [Coxiellaceae bacterium]|nr:Lpg1974 family pore-forming outer membrane protein [Coxiellaceae bacterium]
MKHTLFKTSLISFSCLIPALTLQAGGVETPTKTLIPKVAPGFGVSAGWLYLEAGASNLEYAVYTTPLPAPSPSWQQKFVYPSYTSAFTLGLQYTFADSADQIKLDWLDFSSTDTNSASAAGTATDSIAPPYYFGPGAQKLRGSNASGAANFNLDQLNLVYARLLNIGQRIRVEPFAGLAASYLKQSLSANFTGNVSSSSSSGRPYTINSFNNSTYKAMGPRLGLNAMGALGHHFGITASLGASILVGSMATNAYFISAGNGSGEVGNTSLTQTSLADQSQTAVVPEFDSTLGLSYDFDFKSGSNLSLQAGYLFSVYLDGIRQTVPATLVPGAFNGGTIAIETDAQIQSNFDINGPYIKASYNFA